MGLQTEDGWSDHIGVVESVNNGQITVIEGNYKDAVGRRVIPVGWGYIRGYAAPKYETAGTGGGSGSSKADSSSSENGATVTPTGKSEDTSVARPLNDSPRWKGVVTASALNVRSWAGMEYGNIKAVPVLHYGDPVEVCDTLRSEAGEKWYFVRINGKVYGFVHGDFITRA